MLWAGYGVVFFFAIKYGFDARARAGASDYPDGAWTETEIVKGVSYTARRNFISNETILLRLYRTGDPVLLAERSYQKHGVALRWTSDALIYDTYLDDGAVSLPPTRLDRLLARLP